MEFTEFLKENGEPYTDLYSLNETEMSWLRGLIWDSAPVIQLRAEGTVHRWPMVSQATRPKRDSSRVISRAAEGIEAVSLSDSHELMLHPEKFGWDPSWAVRFTPMIFRLIDLCGFTTEHTTLKPEDASIIGDHLAEKLDSFIQLVEKEHPLLPMPSASFVFFPHQIRTWMEENIQGVEVFDKKVVILALIELMLELELVDINYDCRGMFITHNAGEALAHPEKYAELVWHVLPRMDEHGYQPLVLLDAFIAYLGSSVVAEAMHVKLQELEKLMRGFCSDLGWDNRDRLQKSYVARCILGIGGDELSDLGTLIMRYALAKSLEEQITLLQG